MLVYPKNPTDEKNPKPTKPGQSVYVVEIEGLPRFEVTAANPQEAQEAVQKLLEGKASVEWE